MTTTQQRTIRPEAVQTVKQQLERAGFTAPRNKVGNFQAVTAFHPNGARLALLVRGRTREGGDHTVPVNIIASGSRSLSPDDCLLEFERLCKEQGLTPWIAIYVRATGDVYATALSHFQAKYRTGEKVPTWPMRIEDRDAYSRDEEVMYVNVRGSKVYPTRWFGG